MCIYSERLLICTYILLSVTSVTTNKMLHEALSVFAAIKQMLVVESVINCAQYTFNKQ